ncbi:MAG: adenylosuccinate lyase [bacterium]|nr:adenylosuccinate lyase [bacterium]
MISRYSRDVMAQIWEQEAKFNKWLDVEIAACAAHVKLGNIPEDDFKIIKEKAAFSVDRINEIEAEVNHDVIAFTTALAEHIGPSSRFVHMGLTSTDVVDTALCLLIQDAGKVLLEGIDTLSASLKKQAEKHKHTLCMGRTHGVHAEPTTFGLKLTVYYAEMQRNRTRLVDAIEGLRIGLVSGAVGNFAHYPPELEALVCKELGLEPAPVSTQTLQRDRHADLISTIAIIGGTLDKIATEVRALQKTEFNEAQEPFSSKQKGSSAMPHKRNPITCERVSGLARVLRGYAVTAFENQPLWHERDISHSGAERVIIPDATIALDYMMHLMNRVIKDIVVNKDAMQRNIEASYNIFFSQPLLLRLVNKGITREDGYRMVQRNALAAFDEKVSFESKIRTDDAIMNVMSEAELAELFSFDRYKEHADAIFKRVYN